MDASFDAMKFKKIRDLLIAKNLVNRKNILIPEMISYEDMGLVHSRQYLTRIRNPINVAHDLKIEAIDPWDTHVLEYFRVVAGGTVLAATHAFNNRCTVFNLGGGFHHAHAEKAGGFCLINDVAIAIRKLQATTDLRNILIVDLDYHEGDGNLTIFEQQPEVFTFSMHASDWIEIDKQNNRDIILPENCTGEQYLEILEKELPAICKNFAAEMVFYIAGSDPYEKDMLGDLALTRDQMLRRNMYVYECVKEYDLPMVVVAGGGYGKDSWEVYYDFIENVLIKRK
jgi:acetoin utilization deacetylase AcuC-like enzyme